MIFSIGIGPVYIGPGRVLDSLTRLSLDTVLSHSAQQSSAADLIVNQVRLPRILVGAMVGASLAGPSCRASPATPWLTPHLRHFCRRRRGRHRLHRFLPGAASAGCSASCPGRRSSGRGTLFYGGLARRRYRISARPRRYCRHVDAYGDHYGHPRDLRVFGADRPAVHRYNGDSSLKEWQDVRLLFPYFFVGSVVAIVMSKQLNIIAMGDEIATSLGQRVGYPAVPGRHRCLARVKRRRHRRPGRLSRSDHPSLRAAADRE